MEESRSQLAAPPRARDRRLLLLFFVVGIGILLLMMNLAGSRRTFDHIRAADPGFVVLILLLLAVRYVGSAGSAFVLAEIFGQRLPFVPLYETMMAGQALNRTFSVGGAAGMWARYSFLTRQGMHSGKFAALLVVEDLIGALAIFLIFVAGLVGIIANAAVPKVAWLALAAFVTGIAFLGLAAVYLYRQRPLLEALVQGVASAVGRAIGRVIGKEIYRRDHVTLAVEDFYGAVGQVRRDPARLIWSFLFNILRLALDAASLFFAFWAVGFAISPGVCLVIFTSSSALSTLSATPGELGVMETSLAVLSTALGIPPPTAVSAIVLFRALSYWLPIPVGYFMFGHLEKRGLI